MYLIRKLIRIESLMFNFFYINFVYWELFYKVEKVNNLCVVNFLIKVLFILKMIFQGVKILFGNYYVYVYILVILLVYDLKFIVYIIQNILYMQ